MVTEVSAVHPSKALCRTCAWPATAVRHVARPQVWGGAVQAACGRGSGGTCVVGRGVEHTPPIEVTESGMVTEVSAVHWRKAYCRTRARPAAAVRRVARPQVGRRGASS
eukprot:6193522-Prymnesium_polylepis.1